MQILHFTSATPAPLREAFAILTLLVATNLTASSYAAEFMAGADISSLTVHERSVAQPIATTVRRRPADAIEILSNHGVNWYRLRLFVNPQFQNNFNGGTDLFVAQDWRTRSPWHSE